jgi:hypothetical protein
MAGGVIVDPRPACHACEELRRALAGMGVRLRRFVGRVQGRGADGAGLDAAAGFGDRDRDDLIQFLLAFDGAGP